METAMKLRAGTEHLKSGDIRDNSFPLPWWEGMKGRGNQPHQMGKKMVHLNSSRIMILLALLLFFISVPLHAATRGIHVVAKTGKELYLYKDYHALVVGVGDYDHWPDLRGAARDAEEVAQALKSAGMNVDLLLNPTSKALKDTLNTLTYGVGSEADRAILFFFSGHGETEALATGEKLGYIVPRDAPLPSKDRIGFINTAVSMNQIETYALRIQSKHVLMLFDSCFSGSVFASLKGIPTDISEKSNRPVRQFITAGNENEQVPDVSSFKTCFIQGIRGEADANADGYVTGSELGLYLDSSVVNYSKGCQHPQYGKIRHPKLDKGDFIIKLASSGAEVEEPAPVPDKSTLSVTCNIAGARVIIDDRSVGKTPLSDFVLSPGDHRIRVEKEGYEPYRKRIRLGEGRTMRVTAYLDTVQLQTGTLFVDADPADATIRILNITPAYQRGMALAPGRYHVEVSKRGYETKEEWIDLAAGEDRYVDIRLSEENPAAGGKPFTNSIGMEFVLIPPGTFMMGDESGHNYNERQHRVTITKPFYLQRNEVTQKQWSTVMGNNPSHFKNCGGNCPVENASWNDAQTFIRKLNEKEGTGTYRLPTEAEWEYACRAGSTKRYCFGDRESPLGDYAWYGKNSSGKTHTAASKEPNAWGLYDMHGNVWEWCADWYGDYPSGSVIDPKGPPTGASHVLRGGSWGSSAVSLLSANRGGARPVYGEGNYGFRVVRDF